MGEWLAAVWLCCDASRDRRAGDVAFCSDAPLSGYAVHVTHTHPTDVLHAAEWWDCWRRRALLQDHGPRHGAIGVLAAGAFELLPE